MNTEIKAYAKTIVDNHILHLANGLVERALASGGEWEACGYSWDNLENAYNEYDEPREICQWYHVSDWLAELLRKVGAVLLVTDDGTYWGRCGCGYALEDDMLEIAEIVLK